MSKAYPKLVQCSLVPVNCYNYRHVHQYLDYLGGGFEIFDTAGNIFHRWGEMWHGGFNDKCRVGMWTPKSKVYEILE